MVLLISGNAALAYVDGEGGLNGQAVQQQQGMFVAVRRVNSFGRHNQDGRRAKGKVEAYGSVAKRVGDLLPDVFVILQRVRALVLGEGKDGIAGDSNVDRLLATI